MDQCHGPIVLLAPTLGPNQQYAWANCYQPVYQDSYFLYLTGINQTGVAMILNPSNHKQSIFLPEYAKERVFWEGETFASGDNATETFLKHSGFNDIQPMKAFRPMLKALAKKPPVWHLLLDSPSTPLPRDEASALKHDLRQIVGTSFQYENISPLSWAQRLQHDESAIDSLTSAIKKTAAAFLSTIQTPVHSETELSGTLVGNLLKETPYGLSFSPIIAKNENAAILHYGNNSAPLKNGDLVLMDFGLRWNTMCTDVSRTIPVNGRYSELQRRLMTIVIDAQMKTLTHVQPGISFNQLNDISWKILEDNLNEDFISKGGRVNRVYKKQPHNIGHFLGIQVHDGDSNRAYRSQPLKENNIITIEPGLYGEFEFDGEKIHCGIRIEDNLLITKTGHVNLTKDIPKTCEDIEKAMLKLR
jgi:Xaa-Pro aminopeptidase